MEWLPAKRDGPGGKLIIHPISGPSAPVPLHELNTAFARFLRLDVADGDASPDTIRGYRSQLAAWVSSAAQRPKLWHMGRRFDLQLSIRTCCAFPSVQRGTGLQALPAARAHHEPAFVRGYDVRHEGWSPLGEIAHQRRLRRVRIWHCLEIEHILLRLDPEYAGELPGPDLFDGSDAPRRAASTCCVIQLVADVHQPESCHFLPSGGADGVAATRNQLLTAAACAGLVESNWRRSPSRIQWISDPVDRSGSTSSSRSRRTTPSLR
jgi:hypothetical protein